MAMFSLGDHTGKPCGQVHGQRLHGGGRMLEAVAESWIRSRLAVLQKGAVGVGRSCRWMNHGKGGRLVMLQDGTMGHWQRPQSDDAASKADRD